MVDLISVEERSALLLGSLDPSGPHASYDKYPSVWIFWKALEKCPALAAVPIGRSLPILEEPTLAGAILHLENRRYTAIELFHLGLWNEAVVFYLAQLAINGIIKSDDISAVRCDVWGCQTF